VLTEAEGGGARAVVTLGGPEARDEKPRPVP
jgi:hypothetical protein